LVRQLLLALQVAFVVLLYLFIWRVIRVASRDMSVPQESMVLRPVRPVAAAPLGPWLRARAGQLKSVSITSGPNALTA